MIKMNRILLMIRMIRILLMIKMIRILLMIKMIRILLMIKMKIATMTARKHETRELSFWSQTQIF